MSVRLLVLALLVSCVTDAGADPAPKLRVLYIVESTAKGAGDFRKAIAADTTLEVQTAAKLTGVAKERERFDVVILDDVPAKYLGAAQLAALDAFVTGGGTLFAAGGEKGFGDAGYAGTRLEMMLPVRFDTEKSKDTPSLAVVF